MQPDVKKIMLPISKRWIGVIDQIIVELGMTEAELAKKLEFHQSNFKRIREGDTKEPSLRLIRSLCSHYNANDKYIRTGEGEPFTGGQIKALEPSKNNNEGDSLGLALNRALGLLEAANAKIAVLEAKDLPAIAVPMDPELWDALMRLPQEHFDALKAATLSTVREHGLSEPDESRPTLRVSIPGARGTLK